MIYVLTMWTEPESRHELVLNGPFEDHKKAGEWGFAWGDASGDCPMWQVVDITTTDIPVRPIA